MKAKGNNSDPRFYNPTSAAQLLARQLMESGMGKINNVGEGINSAAGTLTGAYLQNKTNAASAQAQQDYAAELSKIRGENPDATPDELLGAYEKSKNPYVQQDVQGWRNAMMAEQLKPTKGESIGAGASMVDPRTGDVMFTSPNQPGGSGGGQIGYIYDKIKAEHPDWSDTQIIYAAQTGMRQGLNMLPNGTVAPIQGVPEGKGAIKYGEQSGTKQADLLYDPQIKSADKVAERQGESQGNLNYDIAALPQLENTVAKLSELGKKATYTITGQGRDMAVRQLGLGATDGAVAREAYKNTVRNQILPQLRQTFGAQFTKAEGDKLEETLGDINKSPEEKDAALQTFIAQKKALIATNQRMVGQPAALPSSLPAAGASGQPPSPMNFAPDVIQAEIARRKAAGLIQ